MKITNKSWQKYIKNLRKVENSAAERMKKIMLKLSEQVANGEITQNQADSLIVNAAYTIAATYGEAGAAITCEMYDAIAILEKKVIPAAVPAALPTYQETANAVYGTMIANNSVDVTASAVSRLVKLVSVDTLMNNAIRDGAEWAWIPSGDTCAFCIMLASNGWQYASKKALKNGHARHVHANCDCTYAVRFSDDVEVEGYNNGEQYYNMYKNAPLDEWNTADGEPPAGHEEPKKIGERRLNAMRREFYAENKDKILLQKRTAYAKRKELDSSKAEEIDV